MQNKFDITIYLKYFIFPILSIVSILIIYFVLILPYLNLKTDLDQTRDLKKTQIKNFEVKLAILQAARANKDDLNMYFDKVSSLVPSEETPAPLVGSLDSTSSKFNFSRVDENKNIVDQNLANQGYIEVRFNGRTAGPLSTLNFINGINTNKERLINIRDIELFDDRESKYYRVSFIARSIFNKNKAVASLETPVYDILNDEGFKNFIKNYTD